MGSVVAAFTNTKGVAALTDNQVYGPYGNLLYSANGTMGTAKGYTGQYSDSLTGLDYYVTRYYDPVAGVFLSADDKEGNAQGMNPYAYVAQNPETLSDPTGQMIDCGPSCGNGNPPPAPPNHGPVPCTWQGCQNGNSGNSGSNQPTVHLYHKSGVDQGNGCNAECQNDKLLIDQYIQDERAREEAINSAVGDLLSLAADIFAAAADFAAQAYAAFIIDVITIAGHFVELLSNLSTMGLISVPRWFVTLGDAFQNIVPILTFAKGFVEYIGLGPIAGVAGKFANWMATSARAGIMSMVSGLAGGAMGLKNDVLDWTIYNGELDAVDGYNAQTAYNTCLLDYSSDPGRC
jgi:RHS repeat-associated protein